MKNGHHQEESLFEAGRRLEDPKKRKAFLDVACEGKVELRQKVERLLAAQPEVDDCFAH